MSKYIDSEKLKTEIERRRKFHDDATIKFCNNRTIALTHSAGLKEDEEIVVLIDSLQQEQDLIIINKKDWEAQEQFLKNKKFGVPLQQKQAEIDLEEEIDKEWIKCLPTDEGMGLESANIVNEQFDAIARHFYELGQREMRRRITNPEYNAKVVERIKLEYPTTKKD